MRRRGEKKKAMGDGRVGESKEKKKKREKGGEGQRKSNKEKKNGTRRGCENKEEEQVRTHSDRGHFFEREHSLFSLFFLLNFDPTAITTIGKESIDTYSLNTIAACYSSTIASFLGVVFGSDYHHFGVFYLFTVRQPVEGG